MPTSCFFTFSLAAAAASADTLIFQSTGKAHSALRHLLKAHIPGFALPAGTKLTLELGDDAAAWAGPRHTLSAEVLDGIVRRTLIRTLFRAMFDAPIHNETLAAFIDYSTWGATCVLGTAFHKATFGIILGKVTSIRAVLQAGVQETAVGQRLMAAAAQAVADGLVPGASEEDRTGFSLIRQVADGVAFGALCANALVGSSNSHDCTLACPCTAGMLGTTHLTTHALKRIQSNPGYYLPLFHKNPSAFLHEEARVECVDFFVWNIPP